MPRKSIAVFVLVCFVVFSEGCMTWGMKKVGTTAPSPKQGVRIVSLVKTSGATVLFSRSSPGRIMGNAVVGTAIGGAWEKVEVQKPLSLVRKRSDGTVYEIVGRDGRIYPVGSVVSEDAGKIVFFIVAIQPTPVSVPLAEIAAVQLRRFSPIKTAFLLAGLLAAGFAAGLALYKME